MRKRITTVITAVATVCLLSSCTTTGVFGQADQRHETSPADGSLTSSASDTGSDPTQAEVPAFHFASGDLVLGDFEYEAIKDNMFDPCEEITEEEFAAVGLKTLGRESLREEGKVGCGLAGRDVHRAYAIGTTPVTRALQESKPGKVVDPAVSDVVPGLFTYIGRDNAGLGCVAAVDTVRGEFSVIVSEINKPVELEELCASAVEIVEEFYQN